MDRDDKRDFDVSLKTEPDLEIVPESDSSSIFIYSIAPLLAIDDARAFDATLVKILLLAIDATNDFTLSRIRSPEDDIREDIPLYIDRA